MGMLIDTAAVITGCNCCYQCTGFGGCGAPPLVPDVLNFTCGPFAGTLNFLGFIGPSPSWASDYLPVDNVPYQDASGNDVGFSPAFVYAAMQCGGPLFAMVGAYPGGGPNGGLPPGTSFQHLLNGNSLPSSVNYESTSDCVLDGGTAHVISHGGILVQNGTVSFTTQTWFEAKYDSVALPFNLGTAFNARVWQ